MEQKFRETYRELSKKEYDLDRAIGELNESKDKHKEVIVERCVSDILNVLKEEGKLSERDLNLFIGSLANDIKNLYHK
ncbi:hypothetical protein [Cytobacillus praedii]|uniref:Uncharacterized protein n=1 Tax=Cytobacillus praedii TaxID=1742358 RepID=A0A4R1ASJ4_9BACI|nr:hypothetical protein [Cytobacillus praedii]TCJ00497.1 hypothetical protein E0Y62_26605 [Cytobacillus praedii]